MHICRVTNLFVNDALGCNSVSWAPYTALGNSTDGTYLLFYLYFKYYCNCISAGKSVALRLVAGSCDTTVRVWKFDGQWENGHQGSWREEKKIGNPHAGI